MPGDAEDAEVRRGPLWAKLGLALFALVVPATALELGARLLLAPPPPHAFPGLSPGQVADDELLWRNRAGYGLANQHGPINSLGLRGPEARLEKPAGTTRILSLGESSTFGDGVLWNQTYSAVLEKELRRRGRRVQVWNGGVRAWSSVQSTRFLEMEIDRLDPDLVLFYHEVNDFLPTVLRSVRIRSAGLSDRETMALVSGRSWLLRVIRSSRLLTWLSLAQARRRADSVIRRVSESTDVDVMLIQILPYQRIEARAARGGRPWMANPNPLVRVPDRDREATLLRLIALTRSRGVGLVLYHPAYRISVAHRCLLTRIAAREGVPLIEVEELLAEDAQREGLTRDDYFLPDDRYHPNPRGHRVLARGTAGFLLERGLLREPAGSPPSAPRAGLAPD